MKKHIYSILMMLVFSVAVQLAVQYVMRGKWYNKGYSDAMELWIADLQSQIDAMDVESFPNHSKIPTSPYNNK